jgi:hypothetical protein
LRDFHGNPQKFEDNASIEQNGTNEQKVIKERADNELSAAFLGRLLTVYEWPWNSCVVLNSLFYE